MSDWFGASWSAVGWVAASTTAMYVTTVVAVRLAGRRTVARLSAFDVIVTIALGTLVSSTAVSSDPSYGRAVTALVTLLALQLTVGALRRRFDVVRRIVDFAPEVVVRDGRPELSAHPLGAQMTTEELLAQPRQRGVFDVTEVRLALLEPVGGVSVDVVRPEP